MSLPTNMKPHQTTAKVVFLAAFDSELGFSLRERKPATLDDAQIDALELEENFASTGKSKGKSEQEARRRGKEEVSTSSQDIDSPNDRIEEMRKMIKNLSGKLVKLELEAKKSASKNFHNAQNRGNNPQYRKPPLKILPRETKEQQDQVPHPLYLEGPVNDSTKDATYGLEDANLAFSNSDRAEYPLQGNDGAECSWQEEENTETQKKHKFIIIVNNLMISCKPTSMEDMISGLLGRGLVLKIKKRSPPRRKHLFRRNQQCRKPQTKVRDL